MHKSLTIFSVVFVLVYFLQATPQVTGTIVSGTVIDGYFNTSNSYIKIEIRLTGADASDDDMTGAPVNLLYGSSTSASITINTDAEDEYNAQDNASTAVASVSQDTQLIQIAYSMGGMSIKAYQGEVTNPGYDSDAAKRSWTEVSLGLAF